MDLPSVLTVILFTKAHEQPKARTPVAEGNKELVEKHSTSSKLESELKAAAASTLLRLRRQHVFNDILFHPERVKAATEAADKKTEPFDKVSARFGNFVVD